MLGTYGGPGCVRRCGLSPLLRLPIAAVLWKVGIEMARNLDWQKDAERKRLHREAWVDLKAPKERSIRQQSFLAGWYSPPNATKALCLDRPTDAYKHQDADDDGKVPW